MRKHIITLPLASLALITPLAISSFTISSCSKAPVAIRVMSYNIQHGIDHQKDQKGIRVVELDPIVTTIKKYNPDIVNINEIYFKSSKLPISNQVRYIGHKLGYHHYFVKGDQISWMGNGLYGGAIFSRYQLSFQETHPIPNPVGHPNLEKRAVGKVTVTLPNSKTLNIVQSHFGGISDDLPTREAEWQNAVNTTLDVVENKTNVIFMGDLNLVAGRQPDMKYINQIKNKLEETVDESFPTFDSLDPTIHIDYMFCSPGMQYSNGQSLPTEKHSDHLPIICDFNV